MKNKFLGVEIHEALDMTAFKMLLSIMAVAWASLMIKPTPNNNLEKLSLNTVETQQADTYLDSQNLMILN